MPGISTIPIDITITTKSPDLVIVNRINSTITILELSVPFETNISDTHNRKLSRYANLIADIESKNFKLLCIRNMFKRIYFTRKPKQTK